MINESHKNSREQSLQFFVSSNSSKSIKFDNNVVISEKSSLEFYDGKEQYFRVIDDEDDEEQYLDISEMDRVLYKMIELVRQIEDEC